jgi:hypothetical protein
MLPVVGDPHTVAQQPGTPSPPGTPPQIPPNPSAPPPYEDPPRPIPIPRPDPPYVIDEPPPDAKSAGDKLGTQAAIPARACAGRRGRNPARYAPLLTP